MWLDTNNARDGSYSRHLTKFFLFLILMQKLNPLQKRDRESAKENCMILCSHGLSPSIISIHGVHPQADKNILGNASQH